jgi:hypothetical protein
MMSDVEAWRDRMIERTFRQLERDGGTPTGWHVLLPDGDFGFHDVVWPETVDEYEELMRTTRTAFASLRVRACLFVQQRARADGSEILRFQYEATDARGERHREARAHAVRVHPDGGRSIERDALVEAPAPNEDPSSPCPDLLPDPSPLRIR